MLSSASLSKDEDGLYTDNPKVNPEARLIPEVGAQELIEMNLDDLIIERVVLEMPASQSVSKSNHQRSRGHNHQGLGR